MNAMTIGRLTILSTAFALVPLSMVSAQYFQCPAGTRQLNSGGAIMCQCPDGSMAAIWGCNRTPPPRPVDVGRPTTIGTPATIGTPTGPSNDSWTSETIDPTLLTKTANTVA